ncbi:hypothetical protein DH86_00000312 [Scytalidium sp. 3C]|nr:hypothetical protein DH86_00000312 [Scytalidium sp. 3C]
MYLRILAGTNRTTRTPVFTSLTTAPALIHCTKRNSSCKKAGLYVSQEVDLKLVRQLEKWNWLGKV